MQQENTVTQPPAEVTQLGVRVDRELWKECQKVIIDLDSSAQDFVGEALERQLAMARKQLEKRAIRAR